MAPASSTWNIQPEVEKNRTNKLCARCELPASRVCTRCRCTVYCSEECQRKHWRSSHKAQCTSDPLFGISKELSLPRYRDFSAEEKQENFAFTLLPGRCKGQQTNDRDGYCRLVEITEQEFVDFWHKKNSKQVVEKDEENRIVSMMGWGFMGMGTEPVTGFSGEDSVIFRVFFDDNFQNNPELDENLIAHILINCSGTTRGKVVVVKTKINQENGTETWIPFSKAELVDMMTWRVFCGRHQMVSSRMFRENMRRREMQDFMATTPFKTYDLG